MDVGEQDGRYVGGYANQVLHLNAPRQDQYLYLWRHFDRMSADLKDKLSALTSVYFPHYLIKASMQRIPPLRLYTHARILSNQRTFPRRGPPAAVPTTPNPRLLRFVAWS
jgi:hypothetical protein